MIYENRQKFMEGTLDIWGKLINTQTYVSFPSLCFLAEQDIYGFWHLIGSLRKLNYNSFLFWCFLSATSKKPQCFLGITIENGYSGTNCCYAFAPLVKGYLRNIWIRDIRALSLPNPGPLLALSLWHTENLSCVQVAQIVHNQQQIAG